MEPRVLHRLFNIEALKRQGHFFKDRLDAARLDLNGLAGATSDIDGNEAVNRSLGRNLPEQPNVPCRLVTDNAGRHIDRRGHRGDTLPYPPWPPAGFGTSKGTTGLGCEETGPCPE